MGLGISFEIVSGTIELVTFVCFFGTLIMVCLAWLKHEIMQFFAQELIGQSTHHVFATFLFK